MIASILLELTKENFKITISGVNVVQYYSTIQCFPYLPQETPISSPCLQLCFPQPLDPQYSKLVSAPVQARSSNHIGPGAWPNFADPNSRGLLFDYKICN
jgi:hypothetical protein